MFVLEDSSSVHLGPQLRELTYAYRIKTAPDGRPFCLGPALTRPSSVAAVLGRLLGHEAIEVCGVLCLTTRRRVICWHEVSRGSLDTTAVHPREIFKAAIVANAAAIVLGHNHPSGDPEPSFADLAVTARLVAAGGLLGVSVLDHIILGHSTYVSLRASRLAVFASKARRNRRLSAVCTLRG